MMVNLTKEEILRNAHEEGVNLYSFNVYGLIWGCLKMLKFLYLN